MIHKLSPDQNHTSSDMEQSNVNGQQIRKPWLWVDPQVASEFAEARDQSLEALRHGQGLLTPSEFIRHLKSGEMRVMAFINNCYALVSIGVGVEGSLLNILTVKGKMNDCAKALDWLEDAAREAGINVIVSVGHKGWAKVMQRKGYDVKERLFMRKKL